MSNQTPDRGFNTVTDSSVPRRQARAVRQKQIILLICVVVVLMLATLLTLAIGAIVHAANDGNSSDEHQDTPPVVDQDDILWETVTVSADTASYGSLVLIDKDHKYLFPTVADDDLVSIVEYRSTKNSDDYYKITTIADIQLKEIDRMAQDAMIAADKMLVAMSKATGEKTVAIHWGYRSLEAQRMLHEANPDLTWEAGYSDHHSGYGMSLRTINPNKTNSPLSTSSDAYQWLIDHAAAYGFVVRYPADKSDITGEDEYLEYFRYVGVPHATLMAEKNLCLEQYLPYLAQNAKDGLEVNGADGHTYEIYYDDVEKTEVRVPTNCAYSISGTNTGGIIVTIDRSSPIELESESSSQTDTETASNTDAA